jgi:hypothetical protein
MINGSFQLNLGLGAFAIVFALHCVAVGLYFEFAFFSFSHPPVIYMYPSSPHDFRNGVGLPFILVVSNIIVSAELFPSW